MKNVVNFFKGIEVEDFALFFAIGFMVILTAAGIIALPAVLVVGDWGAAFMAGVDIVGTVFFFWIPWYLERD